MSTHVTANNQSLDRARPLRREAPGQPIVGSRLSMSRGISLLEVLIAMFVLTVGLLGLASMVPVGQFQVMEASHADAATAIGRAEAFRLIKVRDMLDAASWVNSGGAAYTPTAPNPVMIDGIGVTNYSHSTFPYDGLLGGVPSLDRVSLTDLASGTVMNAETADRVFRGVDDKNFAMPNDDTLRPQAVGENFTDANKNGVFDNGESYTDANSNGQWDVLSPQAQSRGDFSWMVMVQPAVWWDNSPLANATPGQAIPNFVDGLGTTTVIVFHKRDASDVGTPPSERAVLADVLALSGGGIDMRLRDTTSTSLTQAKQFLKVRPNQWVMISGQLSPVRVPASGTPVTVNTPAIPVHRWYRVVMVGEVEEDTAISDYVTELTLAGPDLNHNSYNDADGDNSTGLNGKTLVCTLCDGVVGVFEKTVQLDEPSLWTAH